MGSPEFKMIMDRLDRLEDNTRQDINKVHDKMDGIEDDRINKHETLGDEVSDVKSELVVVKTRVAIFSAGVSIIVVNAHKLFAYFKS